MRVSLIYIQTIEGNNVNPPLGLLYIAAVAREAGHQIQFMDIDPTMIDIVPQIKEFNPDIIGLSFLTTEYDKAKNVALTLNKEMPQSILCSGGVHTTLDTENVLRSFPLDFCVTGEGENTFLEICDCLEKGIPYDDVKGIAYIKVGRFVKTPLRDMIEDLDSLPFPARDLINFEKFYLTFPGCIKGRYVKSTAIMAGRGCNFNCHYCAAQKLLGPGRQYRLRTPKNVVDEVAYLQETYGIKGVLFQDSTFTANKKWTTALCEEIINRGVKFVWSCNTRVNTVTLEMMKLMKKAGCVQIEYGVESGSPKILKILNKQMKPQQAIDAVSMTESVGIRVGASFMLGNPDENVTDLEMTFNLAKKLNASYTVFFFTIPYPGTELWTIARERKLIPEKVKYGTDWNIRAAESPLMSSSISSDDLQKSRAKYQNHFFVRNYFRINNVVIGLNLLLVILKNPAASMRGIIRVVKYRRWDSFIEEMLVAYRKSLLRYMST